MGFQAGPGQTFHQTVINFLKSKTWWSSSEKAGMWGAAVSHWS